MYLLELQKAEPHHLTGFLHPHSVSSFFLQMSCPTVSKTDYEQHLIAALEQQDSEKQLILAKLDGIVTAQSELSDLRVELVHRTRELHETQQKLSDARIMLQEEREKVARLVSENAAHLCQEEDDRTRIASLIRLVRSELDHHEDGGDTPVVVRPASSGLRAKKSQHSMSLRSLVSQPSRVPIAQVRATVSASSIESAMQPPPNSGLVGALRKEIDTLKTQLDEVRHAYEKDRSERLTDERSRYRQQEDALLKYSKTVDHLQAMLNETTRELCQYRQSSQAVERGLRGDIEALRASCAELEAALEKERCRRTADMKESLHMAAVRSNDVVEKLRAAARENERKNGERAEAATKQIQELEEELAKVKDANQSLKRRSAADLERSRLQVEGLKSDLNLCKQELRAVQKRVYFSYHRGDAPPIHEEA